MNAIWFLKILHRRPPQLFTATGLAAAASSAADTHQPCTCGRSRCGTAILATGPAPTLPASRIQTAC